MSQNHIHLTSLYPVFFRGTIIIEVQTKQILQEVADMIVLKILAAPFVVALPLLALVLFIDDQTLGGVVFLVLAFLISHFLTGLWTSSIH